MIKKQFTTILKKFLQSFNQFLFKKIFDKERTQEDKNIID